MLKRKAKQIRENKHRRPAMSKMPRWRHRVGLGGVLGGVCLALVFVLVHDIVTQARMFRAEHIVVEGNRHLSRQAVLDLAGIVPGGNIFAVNLSRARKRLLTSGWIAAARVGRHIPDTLVVRLTERMPVVRLDLGRQYLMGMDGRIIAEVPPGSDNRLPVVTGLYYTDLALSGEAPSGPFAALLRLLRVADGDDGPLSLGKLTRIHMDRDLGARVHTAGRLSTVWLGLGSYGEKYRRLAWAEGQMTGQAPHGNLCILDLESDTRIVVRPVPGEDPDETTRRS